ncbi:MAG: Maf-like protein [Mesorhizobium sp.]
MAEKLILASGSPYRKALLENAGIDIEAVPAHVDERAVEATLEGSGLTPDDVALVLAEAKADEVSGRKRGALVLGCDQTLSLGEDVLHKPADMQAARRQLLRMSGKTHSLNSGLVLMRDGEALWRHVSVANLAMRELSPTFVGRYLAAVGDKALTSVGAYQIEGRGIQLFEKIDGDYFTIVGLPLLPLLAELRRMGAIDG